MWCLIQVTICPVILSDQSFAFTSNWTSGDIGEQNLMKFVVNKNDVKRFWVRDKVKLGDIEKTSKGDDHMSAGFILIRSISLPGIHSEFYYIPFMVSSLKFTLVILLEMGVKGFELDQRMTRSLKWLDTVLRTCIVMYVMYVCMYSSCDVCMILSCVQLMYVQYDTWHCMAMYVCICMCKYVCVSVCMCYVYAYVYCSGTAVDNVTM